MTARTRALVFGASGYIGTNLVPRLIEAGWQVRAAARHR
ncbi:MAG: NmrA family NAD(P)-binding protein, partial [Gammaproteobacteria bacterium]|nr:NmrA family NAD(P)-binding protein [Gammaproteobacteria bacterium]